MNYYYKQTSNRGIYDNKPNRFIGTSSGRANQASWIVNTISMNQYSCYGMGDYMKSSSASVSDYFKRLRVLGVKDIGFIYGNSSSVTSTLDAYQKKQTSDTSKVSFVVSEIEQYNTGKRTEFYQSIKTVSEYALANNLTRCIYQGWPTSADLEQIIKYSDRLFNHCYIKLDTFTNVGKAIFDYQKSRFNLIVQVMDKLYPLDKTKKYNVQTIFSTENPDQSKEQFGYKYFKTHTFEDPYSTFIAYWNSNATEGMKRRITLGGSMLFVGDQAKLIKP